MKWGVSCLVAVAACGRTIVTPHHEPAPAQPPRLVVSIVIDQLPSDAFLRYLPYLSRDGLAKRMIDEGVFVERMRYRAATTNTAPGHATLYTGVDPNVHGIDTNTVWNYETKDFASIESGGTHFVLGVPGMTASPSVLRSVTVADQVRERGGKTASISLKARSSMLPAGKNPNLALWYCKEIPGFSTSSYYLDKVPEWVERFNRDKLPGHASAVWNARSPDLYRSLLGPDDFPGEADWSGFGTVFPHRVLESAEPMDVFKGTPGAVDALIELANLAIDELQLGNGHRPDLLALSFSPTDYAGHTFGVDSWEYLDLLIHTDLRLGQWLSELEEKMPIAVLLSSDHGGPAKPERTGRGGRIWPDELRDRVEAAAKKELGPGPWIVAFAQPFLWPSPKGWESREKLAPIARQVAAQSPDLYDVIDPDRARAWLDSRDPVERSVALSFAPGRRAFLVIPNKGFHADPKFERGHGTVHGTPWSYDSDVPVLLWKRGLSAPARVAGPIAPSQFTRSLADVLGVVAPANPEAESLWAAEPKSR